MTSRMQETVQYVVDKFLCTSCGVCSGVCSTGAIQMFINELGVYVPRIDTSSCAGCGLCLKTCPGVSFDYAAYYRKIHGALPNQVALGTYKSCYAGYSRDPEILCSSQSGGIVSTILVHCLEQELIDGAIVTKWSEDAPLLPRTFIARTRSEIIEAVGSKYNPVPAAGAVREILGESGRFAFVGTSCQIQGLRKAEDLHPVIADRIVLYLGLHCLGVFTYHFIEQVLNKTGIGREEVASFRHRDKECRGWPCDMRITTRSGKVINIGANESRLWPRPFFTNWRCQLCFDKANEYSDISCGDCRIPQELKRLEQSGYDIKQGISEFSVRTERGKRIVDQLISENKIQASEIDAEALAMSLGVAGKKLGLNTFGIVARIFRLGLPEYGVRFNSIAVDESIKWRVLKPWAVLSSCRYFLVFYLGKYKWFRRLLMRIPHRDFGKIDQILRHKVEWSVFSGTPNLSRTIIEDKGKAS